ncbi:NAD(P)H-hydrate dehydratase [Cuspidothrix issatschenkoi]|uniref:Bifunctional NAD(P)H-hydrate repair enzyme n=1 Tax=Cuspidothrix issatschenkoi CHARLIE-1 TaxID=2052836 RepID=A0A2S6CUP3_9CYAN|nr:NAD(P)H-hydrate dehydratase [Cuspidothrix issatschenkoi]PPJ63422.1 bifunctional ADP-dependent NAD(P)H-hydrate dehydratase/NAD(P)H-hydrate epimerase [Cuspidothrix issatschenkoi CHARLIE-1]
MNKDQFVVTASQMRDIETRIFTAGMPVAALMEKVAGLISQRLQAIISPGECVGILAGSGHNGGDALVVARELHFRGYQVWIYQPFSKLKELTAQHFQYARNLAIPCYQEITELPNCDFLIDGLFGFGLEREITDTIATAINYFNAGNQPIISIDIPSGLHTDTGEVLGTAIQAQYTFCLGLWKQGLLQEQAIPYIGQAQLIDFDIPLADIYTVLGDSPQIKRITSTTALSTLPLPLPLTTHKYKQGHLLLICGSRRYAGGAILTALGARASGVGMLSIAVPATIKPLLVSHLPEALIIGCPETETGAISHLQLPENTDLNSFTAIACGPGLTQDHPALIPEIIQCECPLVLDADALNILAQIGTISTLQQRTAATILTPHTGEFHRLFPHISPLNRIKAVQTAAQESVAIILLKGARTAISNPQGHVWINPESTPALARGGSGDVLTGLLGGLLAQILTKAGGGFWKDQVLDQIVSVTMNKVISIEDIVATATWWHSQAGILAAQARTELGVDAFTLTQYLIPVLKR